MTNLKHISVNEFLAAHGAECCATVIDVRQPEEYAVCHVKGAQLFPLSDLNPGAILDACGGECEVPIYVLCKVGGRARKAAEQIAPLTSREIIVVDGGTDACVAAGATLG